MKRETLFLKAAVFLIGLPILVVCAWGLPSIAKEAAEHYGTYLSFAIFIVLYAAAIPFFMALYQALKLLSYIDKNKAFSELSVKALKSIKRFAAIISILLAIGSPFIYHIAQIDDAPGLMLIGMVIIFASIVIAVFAAVLQKLLNNAIEIQLENDLTV